MEEEQEEEEREHGILLLAEVNLMCSDSSPLH